MLKAPHNPEPRFEGIPGHDSGQRVPLPEDRVKRVGAVVGVLDECELIVPCIAHLRACGIASIIVSDYGSTDGTLERVRAIQDDDLMIVQTHPDEWRTYADWGLREAALGREADVDWVLFIDADEFPVPRTASIKDCIPGGVDALHVPRFNVPLTTRGLLWPDALVPSEYDDVHFGTLTVPCFRSYVESGVGEPFILIAPGKKVLARPSCVTSVAPGQHDVDMPRSTRRALATDLVIAHVPFTTKARLRRKVRNIRAEMHLHPACFAGDWAWHWRRWVALDDAGLLMEEFDRQVLSENAVARARTAGFVQSASEWFRQLEDSRVYAVR